MCQLRVETFSADEHFGFQTSPKNVAWGAVTNLNFPDSSSDKPIHLSPDHHQGAVPSPQARRTERTVWGETVTENHAWLRDAKDPEVRAHLENENAYADAVLAPTAELQETLFGEIKSRVQETDLSVPVHKDGWSYYSRSEEGKDYGIHCRRALTDGVEGSEEVFFDENVEAANGATQPAVPGDSTGDDTEADYFDIGVFEVSPDHRLLLWGEDRSGQEYFDIRIRDLGTNEDLPDVLPGCSAGSAWATDNLTFFYLKLDEAHRPYQVWRHRLGEDPAQDVMVFEEPDERFWCGVGRDRDDSFIHIGSSSTLSDEVWLIPADQPTAPAFCVQPRTADLEYGLSHHDDRFIVLTNDNSAQNFMVMTVPDGLSSSQATFGRDQWEPLIPHREDVMLTGFEILDDFLILFERAEGLTRLSFARWSDLGSDLEANLAAFEVIEQPESVYSVWSGANPTPHTTLFRYGYTSMVTPSSLFTIDLETGERTLLKQQEVLGDFDSTKYHTWREWATSHDGVKVPISLVARKDRDEIVGFESAGPGVVGAYGAYEISQDPGFSVARLSLLDRGYVIALAHPRGGGELGRQWYENGKFEHKPNTFLDVVAVGERIRDLGLADPAQMVLRGGSAGGLMAGAVMNLAPELFACVIAQVAFVDIINTMLDPTLPLTVTEWEEWGDPASSEEIYRVMRTYAPLENVHEAPYPAVFATAGLHDPRVGYWEPAKWVLALRECTTSDAPIILRTEMGAGHGGPTGRYEEWRDEARTLAFLLWNTQFPKADS